MDSEKVIKWLVESETASPVGIVDIAGVALLTSLLGSSGLSVQKTGKIGHAIWNLRMTEPSFSHFFLLVLTFLTSLYLSGEYYTEA